MLPKGRVDPVIRRLKGLGVALFVIGLVFVAAGAYAYVKVQDGTKSLQAYSAAEAVNLNYNADGKLLDHGEVAGGAKIMSLLVDDWQFPVVKSDFDPKDPLVNTASEYMYQMATITEHTLNAKVSVVLKEDVTGADGTVVKAGTYDFVNDGKYWATFGQDPISKAARGLVWSPTAHALIANLGVGAATASALQLGLAVAALTAGLGGTFLLTGFGLLWATRAEEALVRAEKRATVIA